MSRSEQETIFNYNNADKAAIIYTCDPVLQRRLAMLARECPEDYQLSHTYPDGAKEYTVADKRLLTAKKRRRTPDDRRAKMREMARARFGHNKPAGTDRA